MAECITNVARRTCSVISGRFHILVRRTLSSSAQDPLYLSHESYSSSSSSEKSQQQRSVLCMHGILGSKKNFRTAAKQLVKDSYGFDLSVTVDHRGHGQSGTPLTMMGETSHTVGSCADDLHSLLSSGTLPLQAPVPTLICGHSFGGKVALAYLQQSMRLGRPLPSHTWILDSLPGTYNTSLDAMQKPDSSVTYVLGCVQSLYEKNPLDNFRSKDAVVQALMSRGLSNAMAQWLATNLEPAEEGGGRVRFSFDIETISDLFADFCSLDMWDFLHDFASKESDRPATIQFIRAGRNPLWTDSVLEQFRSLESYSNSKKNAGNVVTVHHMPHVGHWLHAEDLNGVLTTITGHSKPVGERLI
eukprot:gene28337-37269_t